MITKLNTQLQTLEERYSSYEIQAKQLIYAYKNALSQTDYKALKYVDGAITDEEYEPYKQFRQHCRERIGELEPSANTFRPNPKWLEKGTEDG